MTVKLLQRDRYEDLRAAARVAKRAMKEPIEPSYQDRLENPVQEGPEEEDGPRAEGWSQRAGMTRRGAIATQQVEVYWTLPFLARAAGMQEQLARLHLRNAKIKRPGTRWRWLEGSKELARVREILKLPEGRPHAKKRKNRD